MTRIELAPFKGDWQKIGDQRHSADSCAGRINGWVFKWSRARPENRKMLESILIFKKKSYELYQLALQEFVVPSLFVAGEKMQGRGREYKPYTIQPFLDCWTGKTAPEEIKDCQEVIDQWLVLYARLSKLYLAADRVNQGLPEKEKFPITLTVGSTREKARNEGNTVDFMVLPQTDNILITKTNNRLYVCDFGPYLSWDEKMTDAYEKIKRAFADQKSNDFDRIREIAP